MKMNAVHSSYILFVKNRLFLTMTKNIENIYVIKIAREKYYEFYFSFILQSIKKKVIE